MADNDTADIDPLQFNYLFAFEDGTQKAFTVRLDEISLALIREESGELPEWTKLSYQQCPNCSLEEKDHPVCPVAANVAGLVEYFKDTNSTTSTEVRIRTSTRRFAKKAPISDGLGALLGLHMVASGCPVLDKLRPMARTHLPFSTHEETMYRLVSMYLLAQYFHYQAGEKPDWDLSGLAALMDEIRDINRSFVNRLKKVCTGDAVLNAMVLLDCYAGIATLHLKQRDLPQIKKIFGAHLRSSRANLAPLTDRCE